MLSNEVVERLGELLAKATPGPWTVHEDSGDMEVLSGNRTVCDDTAYYPHAVDQNDMRLISAAVNALPELLRVYRAWLDAPVVEVQEIGDIDDTPTVIATGTRDELRKGTSLVYKQARLVSNSAIERGQDDAT